MRVHRTLRVAGGARRVAQRDGGTLVELIEAPTMQALSSATKTSAVIKCAVTTGNGSSKVTVRAPKAPCTATSSNAATDSNGTQRGSSRRHHQVATACTNSPTPTMKASRRWNHSRNTCKFICRPGSSDP
jgi:hypothetical protein